MINEDKRKFLRYWCHSSCELKHLNEIYQCTLVNYSDGAGVIIDNIPGLKPGSKVNVLASEPEIELIGKIAWIKERESGLRAGIRRLDNIRGSLRDYPFSTVLFGLKRSAKTGVLEVRDGLIIKKVFVENGDMVFALSSDKADRLGVLLLKEGKITLEQYVDSTNELKLKGQRLGKILVDIGAITPKDLFEVVQHQIEEIILNLFTILHGKFEFFEGPLTSREVITLKISVANLIYRGIKRIDDFDYVEKMCPSLEDILAVNPNPLNVFQDLDIELSNKIILSLVNGNDQLREILAKAESPDFETLKEIFTLFSLGLIYVKRKDGAVVEMPAETGISEYEKPVTDELDEVLSGVGQDVVETDSETEDSVNENTLEMTDEIEEAETADAVVNESFYLMEEEVKTDEEVGIVPVEELSGDPISQAASDELEPEIEEDDQYNDNIDITVDEELDAEVPDEKPSAADTETCLEDKQADKVTAEKTTADPLTSKLRKSRIPAILHNLRSGKGKVLSTGAGAGNHSQTVSVRKSPLKRSSIYMVIIIAAVAFVILFKIDKILEFFPGEQIMYSAEKDVNLPTFHKEAFQDLSGININGKQRMPVFRDDALKILSGGQLNRR